MNLDLEGKTAVVSGSTAGIGFAIAAALAAEGAPVVINGRTEARVKSAQEQIAKRVAGAQLRGVAADLGTLAGVELFLKLESLLNLGPDEQANVAAAIKAGLAADAETIAAVEAWKQQVGV